MDIPNLIQEQIFLRGKTIKNKDSFETIHESISDSNREILSTYPAQIMKEAISKKLGDKSNIRILTPRTPFAFQRTLSYAATICCVLLLSLVTVRMVSRVSPEEGLTERSKGNGARLFIYKKDGTEAVLLKNKTPIGRNEIIQISYLSGGEAFGAILSVDGNGVITQHFPDSGNMTTQLSSNGEVSLDFSYKLDDAPKFERFIFITGNESISIENYKKSIANLAIRDEKGNFDIASSLPEKIHVTDIVLLK